MTEKKKITGTKHKEQRRIIFPRTPEYTQERLSSVWYKAFRTSRKKKAKRTRITKIIANLWQTLKKEQREHAQGFLEKPKTTSSRKKNLSDKLTLGADHFNTLLEAIQALKRMTAVTSIGDASKKSLIQHLVELNNLLKAFNNNKNITLHANRLRKLVRLLHKWSKITSETNK